MSEQLKHGGPAFPLTVTKTIRADGVPIEFDIYPGLTVRDWFAGKAMQGFLAGGIIEHLLKLGLSNEIIPSNIAALSFDYADEMLKERAS